MFSLSNFSIHVAEECSGIRSALSLFITSLVGGHFFLRSAWTKMGLVAVVVPLAIVKNAFRIVGLALLANYVDPTFITDSVWHRSGGIPLFLLSLVVLFSFAWLLRIFKKSWDIGRLNPRILSGLRASCGHDPCRSSNGGLEHDVFTGHRCVGNRSATRQPVG